MTDAETQAEQGPDDTAGNTPSKGGRPSMKTPELVESLLFRIANGETLTAICRDEDMPAYGTVWRWRQEDSGFSEAYERARVAQMERWADEILEIADDTTLDTVTKRTPQGREYEAVDQENIQRSRLRVDTRKFLMAKIAPHLYGDKVEVDVSGSVKHGHIHAGLPLDDKEAVRRLALFMLEDAADESPDEEEQTGKFPVEEGGGAPSRGVGA